MSDIFMCVDRTIDPDDIVRSAELAVIELPANAPFWPHVDDAIFTPERMALITNKMWAPGRTLSVAFLDGTSSQINTVAKRASVWMDYANLTLQFGASPAASELRVSFRQQGAWSYIGTDALSIPANQPTINFGFLQEGTVEHEFGHALGCIHEHQQPSSEIPWNKAAVYAYYGGPPNNWNKATIDQNIFGRYAKEGTQFTKWDKGSIMEYPIDPGLITDQSFAVGWNTGLSATDKAYIAQMYPKPKPPDPPPPPTDKKRLIVEFTGDFKVVSAA